jgi:outer membrane protein assembly factor BamB
MCLTRADADTGALEVATMRMRGLSLAGAAVLIVLLGACAGGGAAFHSGGTQQDGSQRVAPGWPAFPGEGAPGGASPSRKTSGAVSVNGDGWVQQAGTGNYADTLVANAYVIVPGGDEDLPLAWAWYTVTGLDTERPVSVDLHVTAAPIVPGGDEDLPLSYWVGVSDYTLFAWQWSGPYTASGLTSITLNDKQTDVLDRYVSADTAGSTFHVVLATLAQAQFVTAQNPKGLSAARIETLTVHTLGVSDPGYDSTRPHYAAIENIGAGGGGGKGSSALDPLQYVTLTWTHIFDPANPDCEAIQYKLYRQGPMDATLLPIGSVNAPTEVYVDPTDNVPGIDDPVPGATYSYWLRAFNPQGFTPFNQRKYSIPLLPPTNVQATDDYPFIDKIVLTWTKAEAATGYKIYRDGQTETELITAVGDVTIWEDTSIADYNVHTYWLRSTNQYMPDGGDWSQAELGHCVQVGPGDWWVFGRDRRHTRCSPFTGPATSALRWSYATGGWLYSSPAIRADGAVYVANIDDNLYAINPDGSLRWTYTTGDALWSSPAIGADGTVYVGSGDNKLYAINPNGSLKWAYTTGGGVISSPAIDADGTVYVGSHDNNLYAINPDGSLKWSYTTGDAIHHSSPAIGADGTVYVGSLDNNIYAINPDGSLKWAYLTGAEVFSSPAIGADGTVYVGSFDNKLYAINADGSLKWAYTTGDALWSSPALGADGTVYVGSNDYKLYAIYPDGSLKWAYTTGGGVISSPAIGADGTVYVGSEDDKLCAINPDSTLKWQYSTGSNVYSSPAIAADGTVYVGSMDGKLYAIGPGGG